VNGYDALDWEWVGIGMILWEWEGIETIRVITTHVLKTGAKLSRSSKGPDYHYSR